MIFKSSGFWKFWTFTRVTFTYCFDKKKILKKYLETEKKYIDKQFDSDEGV